MQDFTSLTQALKTAPLDEILTRVSAQVKSHPQDMKARDILFKLYCIDGAWDKALMQLQTMALLDSELKKQTELYKNLVFSEVQRQQVLTGERQAATLKGEMPGWMLKIHQANSEHYQGESEQALTLREEGFEQAPENAGRSETLGEFSWIADSDSRLGPICEFICAGGYRWVPYAGIQRLNLRQPEDLLDLLWLPAEVNVEGETYYGYVPARYPVAKNDSQEIKLGLKTELEKLSEMVLAGSGRKVLLTDLSEQAITEAGDIVFK
ncbi:MULTISPECIES: type VI secretion system accessory protein TagJ [Pantoea]|uniref:ImpE family T6SS protein Cts1E n=1 Tax=Enterobacter agglomerans TaxID=549 RepID=A0AAN2K766_ENTAG|nr:type VI secretion system accessory protein TagJ [Pantoea agglomerans]CAH6320607.1 ImpE family T6SS protein Cts1E [Pantoea agglomerans]